nr:MAG TPA: hypothetical protein [Caudoviricetes sp.]
MYYFTKTLICFIVVSFNRKNRRNKNFFINYILIFYKFFFTKKIIQFKCIMLYNFFIIV